MVDWEAVKAEYVAGYVSGGNLKHYSVRELARRHGCSHTAINGRIRSENWQAEQQASDSKKLSKVSKTVENLQVETMIEGKQSLSELEAEISAIRRKVRDQLNERSPNHADFVRLTRLTLELRDRLAGQPQQAHQDAEPASLEQIAIKAAAEAKRRLGIPIFANEDGEWLVDLNAMSDPDVEQIHKGMRRYTTLKKRDSELSEADATKLHQQMSDAATRIHLKIIADPDKYHHLFFHNTESFRQAEHEKTLARIADRRNIH